MLGDSTGYYILYPNGSIMETEYVNDFDGDPIYPKNSFGEHMMIGEKYGKNAIGREVYPKNGREFCFKKLNKLFYAKDEFNLEY